MFRFLFSKHIYIRVYTMFRWAKSFRLFLVLIVIIGAMLITRSDELNRQAGWYLRVGPPQSPLNAGDFCSSYNMVKMASNMVYIMVTSKCRWFLMAYNMVYINIILLIFLILWITIMVKITRPTTKNIKEIIVFWRDDILANDKTRTIYV